MKMLMCVKGNSIGSQTWINTYRKLLISGRKGIILSHGKAPLLVVENRVVSLKITCTQNAKLDSTSCICVYLCTHTNITHRHTHTCDQRKRA